MKKNFFFFLPLFLFFSSIVILFGYANKGVGLEIVISNLYLTIGTVLVRINTHADSFYTLITSCSEIDCEKFNLLDSLTWRLSYFTNFNNFYDKEIITPARINFLNTFGSSIIANLTMAGSSPGLFASMFLSKHFLFGFLVSSTISSYMIFSFSSFIKTAKEESNTLFFFLFYYLTYWYITSNPLEFLILFSPAIFIPLTLIWYVGKNEYFLKIRS